ncbi:MAG TPA: hypothetical protein VK568_12320 [Thermodesulfobacteriota bacterium]|nr:hypothetical protein [Thermodesulfobacteriota bacterium]
MKQGSEERIDVIAYSGYRGEETPRTILLNWKRIEVVEILRQWVEERSDNRKTRRFYQIRGSDGDIYTIYYDEKSIQWFHINSE